MNGQRQKQTGNRKIRRGGKAAERVDPEEEVSAARAANEFLLLTTDVVRHTPGHDLLGKSPIRISAKPDACHHLTILFLVRALIKRQSNCRIGIERIYVDFSGGVLYGFRQSISSWQLF
jgi:hypothetical protein